MQTAIKAMRHTGGQAVFRRIAQQRPAPVVVRSTAGTTGAKPTWQVRMLYDGDCPLCMKEVDFLKSRDAGRGIIDFVDISSPDYSPADNAGVTFEQAMQKIHAILPDGKVVTEIEVFRRLYEAIGLGWVYATTQNPTVEKAANAVYGFWAKYRTQITGREALAVILERRRKANPNAGSLCGEDGTACEIPLPKAKQAAGGSGSSA